MKLKREYAIRIWRGLVLSGFFWMASILGGIKEDVASLKSGETIIIISEQQLNEEAQRFEEDRRNRQAVRKADPWLSL